MQIASLQTSPLAGVLSDNLSTKNQETVASATPKVAELTKLSISTEDAGYELSTSRETYGLMVLELMSDPEYQAFERATVGMTQGEKMVAAQSLYRLSELQSQNAKASFPQEQNNGYAKTVNFGDKFARALYLGETGVDIRS